MGHKSFKYKRFRNIGVVTLAAVYFLILVGGIVRSTGSGMGCPDWPKCFGSWVPPTHVSQLPADYREVYQEKRLAKNQRVGKLLQNMGFEKTAASLFAHPSALIESEFNATKTWIEYLNRLVGVVIGILIFATLLSSFAYWKKDRAIVFLSLFTFFLVGFQGWLGSLVVSTNLLPILVSLHMALALVMVAVMVYTLARAQSDRLQERALPKSGLFYGTVVVALLLSFVQILFGTQVREQIDLVALELGNQFRNTWIDQLGIVFYVHRSFSLVVLLVNVYLAFLLFRGNDRFLKQQGIGVLGLVFINILTGVLMAYFSIPAALQPVHLFFATLLFGLQMIVFMTVYYAGRPVVSVSVPTYSKV
ncbi:heme A synthase [soil metagenome]